MGGIERASYGRDGEGIIWERWRGHHMGGMERGWSDHMGGMERGWGDHMGGMERGWGATSNSCPLITNYSAEWLQ